MVQNAIEFGSFIKALVNSSKPYCEFINIVKSDFLSKKYHEQDNLTNFMIVLKAKYERNLYLLAVWIE